MATLYIKYPNPSASPGVGDVVGPASATDNAVARFDGTTGKIIKNSVVIVDNSGNTSGVPSLTYSSQLKGPAGSVSAPVLTGPNLNDGIYFHASNHEINFSVNSTFVGTINATAWGIGLNQIVFGTGVSASNSILTASVTNGSLSLSGDTSTSQGPSIRLYGSTHATLSNKMEFYVGTSPALALTISSTGGVFNGTVTGSNLSGTNTGNVTLAAVGSAPNANGATLTGQALNLEPASASQPGVVTTGAQTFAGVKTLPSPIITGVYSTPTFQKEANPSDGATITVAAGQAGVRIAGAGTIATQTIKLPPSPVDGQHFWVASSKTITTVTWQDSAGDADVYGGKATIGGTGTIGGQSFVYDSSSGVWFAISG